MRVYIFFLLPNIDKTYNHAAHEFNTSHIKQHKCAWPVEIASYIGLHHSLGTLVDSNTVYAVYK